MIHTKKTTCRICARNRLQRFLSLGHTPLANSFLHSKEEFGDEKSYPIDVYYCEDCHLVQLLDVIDPEYLFRDYIYLTGTSETIAAHNVSYAKTLVDLLKLEKNDLVVEIASNDGSLLKCFQQYNVRTLGVEPAMNIAQIANERGIETIVRFFNSDEADDIREIYGKAKVVIGNNVLGHVDEARDFLMGFTNLVAEDGFVVIEVPYLRDLIQRLEYDTIYHEHLSYFSVTSLLRLFESVGLKIIRVDHIPVHGGSIRIYAGLSAAYGDHGSKVLEISNEETSIGLNSIIRYDKFARDVEDNRFGLKQLLESLTSSGKTIAGYGAPAKGNTLLNYCEINNQLITFTVDMNPMKIGLFTPGMHIPVLPVSALLEQQLDYVMILAWNFAEEVMRQQKEHHARGGRFIIPIPEPRVI